VAVARNAMGGGGRSVTDADERPGVESRGNLIMWV
jgi:hypothetical protein